VSRLQGSLAIPGAVPVQGSSPAASARWCWAALGPLLVLALSAISTLAERESQFSPPGSVAAQPSAQALPTTFGAQSTSLAAARAPSTALPPGAERRAAKAYAKLPLSFVPNAGQTDGSVRYYAQGAGYSFYLTDHKAVLALERGRHGEALDLRFLDANPNAKPIAADRGAARVNYLTDSAHHTNLPTYGRLVYRNLWPGIDMVFAGKGGKLSYAFHLRPGAKVSDIRLAYAGAKGISLGTGGAMQIHTPLGTLKDARPQSFQRIDGRRVPVDSSYLLAGDSYGFSVSHHDPGRPLVIDPSLAYSTFLGGSDSAGCPPEEAHGPEQGNRIALDSSGAAYVTGFTDSTDFPTTPGAFDTSFNGSVCGVDAFVAKLNPAGTGLVSTFLGGSSGDEAFGIAVDSAGAAYVTGGTSSTDFPTTAGAFDTSLSGSSDAFVTKLDPAGSHLDYSTYLGGSSGDGGRGIAVDSAGAAYVTGSTGSTDFPISAGAFDTSFIGGLGDAFVTKLDPAGSGLAYSSYLGGSSAEGSTDIAVDSAGAAYVTGGTSSTDFPTTAGAFDTSLSGSSDAFVAKLDPPAPALTTPPTWEGPRARGAPASRSTRRGPPSSPASPPPPTSPPRRGPSTPASTAPSETPTPSSPSSTPPAPALPTPPIWAGPPSTARSALRSTWASTSRSTRLVPPTSPGPHSPRTSLPPWGPSIRASTATASIPPTHS
jgi:Beta-propeller repeat